MRVGYHSPLPPERSGVAGYSASLLPALRRRLEVVVVRRGRSRLRRAYDVPLYHLGNNPRFHAWILRALNRRPGVIVLHEIALHGLVASLTLGRGDTSAYLRAVERDGGAEGRLLAAAALEGVLPPLWETRPLDFPLVRGVLDQATGVIVHSRFAEEQIRAQAFAGALWRVPFPVAAPPSVRPADVAPGRFPVVSSLGEVTSAKRIPQLLEAFALLRRRFSDALLLLAGFDRGQTPQLAARAERHGLALGRDVLPLGEVGEERFWSLLARSDICVGLRWPTLGETSAGVMRALALGRAVVVSDVGWYAELPAAVAARVPPGDREVELLAATLERLAEDGALRESLGAYGAAFVRETHDVARSAEQYANAVEEAAGAAPAAAA